MTVPAADWIARFSGLEALDGADRARLVERARLADLPAGAVVFTPGAACDHYLLVVEGSVRVQMVADNGREIVLYRVRSGESCVLTTSCLIGEEVYAAEGLVEAATRAVVVPRPLFDELIGRSEPFRRFVFTGFGRRVADILATMESAVFHRIDARLARHLLSRREVGAIAVTHQDLASELGTAREVVSRHLKTFERRGLMRLGRGTVEILDRPGLVQLAAFED